MPYCTNCGTQERDDQRFCVVCGAATPGASVVAPMPAMPPISTSEWSGEAQVRVGFSMDPPRQSRWTILVRLFLAFPLLIVATGIALASAFVTVAAWFCALITGRVPDDIQRFLTNALRLYANVVFYAYFLTSRWPGISFNPKPHDQVTIDVDHVSLSRWAVFFRYPLAIPAAIVASLLLYGSYPILNVMWLWGIIAGREPRPLHQALSLVLRYQIRSQAYASLMTPTQPFKGLFGDGKVDGANNVAPLLVSPAVAPTPASHSSPALVNRWFVVKGAKVVLIVILVLGVPSYALFLSVFSSRFDSFPFVNRWKTLFARVIVTGMQQNVATEMNQFQITAGNCFTHGNLRCVANTASQTYSQLTRQTTLLQSNFFFPSTSLKQVARYEATIDVLESDLLQLESSTSDEFDQVMILTSIPKAQSATQIAYQALSAQLNK